MRAAAVIVLVLGLGLASSARADVNYATVDADTDVVSVRTGEEHGVVVGVGYAHGTPLLGRDVLLGVDATVAMGGADLGDWQVRAPLTAPLARRGRWIVIGAIAPIVRGTHDQVADMIGVAADVAVNAGRYTPRWFAAGELGLDGAIATHVTHSDAYRMLAYPDARDGWYRATGATLRYGVQVGASFGRYDAILRLGQLRELGDGKPMLPIYGTVAIAARF